MTNISISAITANIVGIMLIITLYFSNTQRMTVDSEMKTVLKMMIITLFSCGADSLVYYAGGKAGKIYNILIYIGGSWPFLATSLLGYTWIKFLSAHMGITLSDFRQKVYKVMVCLTALCLVINLFSPFVFTVTDNMYERGTGYVIFFAMALFYVADSLLMYIKCCTRAGFLKFFPVNVFVAPIIVGGIIQALFSEISVLWASVAIALAGVMSSLKNETIFTDRLTGLYNRVYLEFLQRESYKKNNATVSGVMIDLNGFKRINDNFGHGVGDSALIEVAKILNSVFGEHGAVVRYAGDEFVVLINTVDRNLVDSLIEKANRAFRQFNRQGEKPYRLSAAMGYAILDLKEHTTDDFMNTIDSEMYKDKMAYYKVNNRRHENFGD